jgi:hypothetical protein
MGPSSVHMGRTTTAITLLGTKRDERVYSHNALFNTIAITSRPIAPRAMRTPIS